MEQKFSSLARALVEHQQRILSTEKEDSLIAANNLKLQQLAEFNRQREEEQTAYRQNTTAGILNLDPNTDPVLHTIVNTAARAGAVGSRIIGQVAAAVEGAAKEGVGIGGIDENIREARARELKGNATQADLQLLDYAPRPLYGAASSKVKGQTNRERIQHWEKTQDDLAKTKEFFNIDNIVDRRVDRPFQEELKQGAAAAGTDFSAGSAKLDNKDYLGALANYASGAGTLAKNVVKAGVNNPLGAFNAVVENAPQLAAGIAFGLPGTVAVAGAYATDAYQEALEAYRKEHNGAMPSKDWQKARMMEAAALMGAETISDRLTLGAGKAISGAIKGTQKAVDELGEGALKTALNIGTKTAASTPVSTAIGGAIGAAGEYGTESFQTVVENTMKGKGTSLEEAHIAGAMGAWGGGPFAAASALGEKLSEKADQYRAGRQDAANELAKQALREEEIKKATETGDISVFLDKESADYSPDKALGVLQTLSESADITEERKAELVPKASEVLNEFGLQIEAIKSQLAGPEEAKNELATYEQLLNTPNAVAPEKIPELQALVEDLRATVSEGELAPEVRAAKEQQLADLEAKYKTADVLYTEMSRKSVSSSFKDTDVDAEIASGSPESIGKLKLLAMASPETAGVSLSIDQARTLASSTNPNVTVADKKFFTAYADSLMKAKPLETMGKVAQEVLYGSKERDQKGLLDYRERFGLFMAQGNTAKADKELSDLAAFEANQKNKVDAINAAVKQFNQTSEAQIVAKTSDGTWAVIPQKADPTYKRKAGEYIIENGGKANSLLRGATASLEAIQATSAFLESYKSVGAAPANTPVAPATPSQVTTNPVTTAPEPTSVDTNATGAASVQLPTNPTNVPAASTAPVSVKSAPDAMPVEQTNMFPPDKKIEMEQQLVQAEKAKAKLQRSKGPSLWTAVKHSMSESELRDTYGNEWKKRFTMLRGKPGVDLSTKVRTGELDAFLPPNLGSLVLDSDPEKESDAVEYIKENLRQRNYLTFEKNQELAQLELTIAQLDSLISNETLEALERELESNDEKSETKTPQETSNTAETSDPKNDGERGSEEAKEPAQSNTESGAGKPENNSGDGRENASEEVAEVEAEASAKLAALKDVANRASKWLKQAVTRKANAKNQSLLTAIGDLFSTENYKDRIAEFVVPGNLMAQQQALTKVENLYKEVAPFIQKGLMRVHPSKREKSVLDDLLVDKNGKVDLEENVKIAMTLAGLAYLRDGIDAGLFNDPESINLMLEQPKDAPVSGEVIKQLGVGYSRHHVIANSIGEQVVKSLGLKAVSGTAPKNYLANLEAVLGALTIKAMTEAGYLTVREISDKQLQGWMGNESANGYAKHTFVSVKFNVTKTDGRTKHEWSNKAKSLHTTFRGETSNLAEMFDVQTQTKMPSFEPIGFDQKSIKRSTKGIPKRLRDYLTKVSNTPYTLKKEAYRFLANLDEATAHELIGVDTRPVDEIHGDNQMSVDAKNAGLIRGYELLKDFVTNGIENQEKGWDAAVYFMQEVWNNQRVGVKSAINMQADKLHRFMFTTKAWETEIKKDDYAAIGKFKLRVLEGFGVKTDGMTAEAALTKDWNDLEDNQVVQAGVAVLQQQLRDPNFFADADQQKAVLAAVKVAGTNAHALDAMLGYAAYKNMEASGADSFTTNMVGEIDGVNNGPILTLLFLGVSNLAQYLGKGGFFKVGSDITNSNVWKSVKSNLDIYQTATNAFLSTYAGQMTDSPQYKSLFYFTGPLSEMGNTAAITKDGRNLAKRPNTAFFFGSGKGSMQAGLAEEFLDKVLGKIEKVYATKDKKQQEAAHAELVKNLNTLLPANYLIPANVSINDLMASGFKESVRGKMLKEAFINGIGKPFADTLAGNYRQVSQLRNLITGQSEIMYSLYSHVYVAMKNELLKDKVERGEITQQEADNWDITEAMAQELREALRDFEPVVHSVQSKKDGNAGLNTGLPVVKQKKRISKNEKYERFLFLKKEDGKDTKLTIKANEEVFGGPGVGMLAKEVHSSDSGISHSTNPEYGAVNVHDAKITGLAFYSEVGTELNQATFDVLVSYSPLREVYNARVRQMEALAKLKEDFPKSKEVIEQAVREAEQARKDAMPKWADRSDFNPASDLSSLFRAAQNADITKLGELSQLGFVDQYGNEGGQYNVTEEDRKRAKREMDYLITNNFIPESVYQAIEKATGEKPVRYEGRAPENRVVSDLDMTGFYRDNKVVSVAQALEQLYTLLASRGQASGFQAHMVKTLLPLVSDKSTVTLVDSPNKVPSEVKKSRGWTDGAGNVYVLDPAMSHSGLTPELVLHEVMHSVLRNIIDNPKTPEQKAVVAELKSLHQMVADKLAGTEKASTFKQALSSIHEFVSYGSTNAEFQAVLAGIGTKQKNGFTQFVQKIVKLIFPNDSRLSSAALNSALGDLFEHMGTLFETIAAKDQQVPENGLPNGDLLSMASPDQGESLYTTGQIFNQLSSNGTTQEFRAKLESVLELVVNRLQGPYGAIRAVVNEQEGKTPLDAWAAAEARGERMFHGKVLHAGLKFSEQEAFVAEQVEAVMTEVLDNKAAANSYVYKEIEKVFLQARDSLKGKISDELYKFVFMAPGQNSGMGGKSNYMARFVALSQSSQEFNTALGFATARPKMDFTGKTILERVEMLWRASIDWVSARYTGTYLGQRGNERMGALVRKLVQVEVRYRSPKSSMFQFLGPVEAKGKQAIEFAKDKVVAAASSKFVAENRFMMARTAGIVVKTVAGNRVEQLMNGINELNNKMNAGKPNEAIQFMNYLKGPGQWLNEVVRMAKKTEATRKHIINDVSKFVLDSFKDGGAYLQDADKKAVTAVLLRTGAQYLHKQYTMEGLQKMLESPKDIQKAIDAEVAQLSQHPEVHYWMAQASGLAWMKVTGWAGVARQNLNAHNMAHLYNTGNPSPSYAAKVIPNLERLIALYGLQHASEQRKDDVARVAAVMAIEAAQGAQNGIRDTLDIYSKFDEESKAKLFKDSAALHIHGWTPEVHNPNVSFEIARTDDEAKQLVNAGYTYKTDVPVDKNDPDKRRVQLFVIKGAGLPRRVSGGFSFTGTGTKGSQKHSQYFNPLDNRGQDNMVSMNAINSAEAAEVQRQFLPNPGFKPGFENRLVPVLNANGKMVDYRYMMKESLRDEVLERNNDFAHLLGVMAGTTFDKTESREQNKQLSASLHEIYKKEFGSNPKKFVQVSAKSADPELREIWDLLPSNTKMDIRKEWGGNAIWVPKEMILPLFGYRKATLSSLFDKENKNKAEQVFTEFTAWMVEQYAVHRKGLRGVNAEDYAKRTALVVRRTEDMWEEVVREMKDIIVVKTGIVLLGNISSNVSLLVANGLNPVKALTLQAEGLRAVMDYQRDRNALEQLKLRLDTQSAAGNMTKLVAERNRLEDAIARNPAKELIDAGLLPTIVDDVSLEDDPYSYRSNLTKWAEEKTAGLNKHVVKAGRFIYMSKDTVMYQFLSKSTQYSDFVARYALYKHETSKKDAVPKAEALYNVSESFVNYDTPMPKTLQYLDDHGMMNFIKYFFSIQRVLAKLVKEKPIGVINVIALNNMLGDFPIITDSSALLRIGNNPLGAGALGYPLALPDLMTVDLGTGMFK